jgi:hypothetical protein
MYYGFLDRVGFPVIHAGTKSCDPLGTDTIYKSHTIRCTGTVPYRGSFGSVSEMHYYGSIDPGTVFTSFAAFLSYL